jgi:hypothetical protein
VRDREAFEKTALPVGIGVALTLTVLALSFCAVASPLGSLSARTNSPGGAKRGEVIAERGSPVVVALGDRLISSQPDAG